MSRLGPPGDRSPTRRWYELRSTAETPIGDGCWGPWGRDTGTGAPSEAEVAYAGVTVARHGVAVAYNEGDLLDTLVAGDFVVALSIGDGPGRASVLTTDLTPEYVRFNGERS